jgi:tetratricopeptide (TPR) repeat protein
MMAALILLGAAPCAALEPARPFLSALEAYKAGDYPSAIANFEALAQSGLINGRLFYNLGNAHLKNNDLGAAILWYERALKLLPNDPDLRFNLDYARSRTKDAPEDDVSPLVRIFFFWNYQFSERTIKIAAIGANLLCALLLGAWRLSRRRGWLRTAWIVAALALILVLTAAFNYYASAQRRIAIVLPSQIAVRSGLEESSTQLFLLHAGAKVMVVKELKAHFQIRFSDDKIGWVVKEAVGVI